MLSALGEPSPAGSASPAGIYLQSITVAGFRGIGRPARLRLTRGNGLIVVTGRDGSGKSSFAEAVELALTGQNSRWNRAARCGARASSAAPGTPPRSRSVKHPGRLDESRAVSAACHHHDYELGPAAEELRTLHDEVRVLTRSLGTRSPSS
ncbi:AAA family ATPase [Streptosporangium sp. DT93]